MGLSLQLRWQLQGRAASRVLGNEGGAKRGTLARVIRAPALCAAALLWLACKEPPPPDPKLEAEGLYLQGRSQYLKGDFAGAQKSFERARALNPGDPRLPTAVGELLLAQGKLDEALAQLELAVKQSPKSGTLWGRIGFIRAQLQQDGPAREALGKALALAPQDYNALETLAALDAKAGALDAAVKGYAAAAQAAPVSERASLWMEGARLLVAADRRADALALLQQAAKANAKSPELLTELGDLCVQQGALPLAVDAYREAALLSPKDALLWETLGELNARLDRPAEAEAAYRQALKVQERATVHVALSRLRLAQGNREAARQELELALKSATGEEPRESEELAELLVTFDRKADALKLLEVLAAEPESAQDARLLLRVAQLAKELGQNTAAAKACLALARADAGVSRCP